MSEKYQQLAETGDKRPSRFISSISVILYLYLFLGGIIASIPMIFVLITNKDAAFELLTTTDTMFFLKKYVNVLPDYIFTNLSIFCMLLGVFIAVKYIHNRPFITLITNSGKYNWRKFWAGFTGYGLLILAGTLADYIFSPETYSITFDPSKFWIALPIILIMTPIQAATEEFVFRGYVIQSFGIKIKNAIILSALSGFFFTLPHLANPEIFASNKLGIFSTVCMILNYFVFGVALALVTIKTDSLEIAIGAHTVNNLICFLLVGYPDGAIPTNTVFFTTQFDPVSSLISAVITSILFYYISIVLTSKSKKLVKQLNQED